MAQVSRKIPLRLGWLADPKTIFAATIAGGLLGVLLPSVGKLLKPAGDIYIAALSISIVPLMMTALVSGLGRMLRSPVLRPSFPRFALAYLALLPVPAVIAIAVGLVFHPGGDLSPEAAASLGERLSTAAAALPAGGLDEFLINIIPSNIFRALSAQNFAAIVIFSLLLGIGLGLADTPAADHTLDVTHSLYMAFSRIFEAIMKGLAVGLFCLMAGVTATVDLVMFESLIGFIAAFYFAAIVLLAFYVILLLSLRRIGGVRNLAALRQPFTISFLANNPFIALRPSMEIVTKRFDAQEDETSAVMPFGIIANQHGQIMNFILITMFLANVYSLDLSGVQLATLSVGSVIGGTAVVGGGAALAPALTPILGSVSVPGDLAVVILTTTEQIVGPMVSLLTVFSSVVLLLIGRGTTRHTPAPAAPASSTTEAEG